jgi:hypothetical protein
MMKIGRQREAWWRMACRERHDGEWHDGEWHAERGMTENGIQREA